MKQYRVVGLKDEFPFLIDLSEELHLSIAEIDRIKIERGDRSLLRSSGYEEIFHYDEEMLVHYEIYFAIMDNNEVVRLDACREKYNKNKVIEWNVDSVGDQCFVRKITPMYIVKCTQSDKNSDGSGKIYTAWTIYKMHNFDLKKYHEERILLAKKFLDQELVFQEKVRGNFKRHFLGGSNE